MHGPINVISPNNSGKWQMGFNSAFRGLIRSGKGTLETNKTDSSVWSGKMDDDEEGRKSCAHF
jgi:hypothetical protein